MLPRPPVDVAALNTRFEGRRATALLHHALRDGALGRVALVSSFGADAVVLLHMVARIAPGTPVLFIDTAMLFPETLAYQRQVAAHLGLRDLRILRARADRIAAVDAEGTLHARDPDACCALRKVDVLARALTGFDTWITGRRRNQGGPRQAVALVEGDTTSGRIKLNPLATWQAQDVAAYLDRHDLPRHPLVARGYASIGCAPCTSPVAPGEDPRAGRWRGLDKTECGLHLPPRPAAPAPQVPPLTQEQTCA